MSSDVWKASAAPWKLVMMLARHADLASAPRRMASTASPSEAPGARLKETVVAGNWPRRSICSGAVCSSKVAIADSGTCLPPVEDGR